MYAFVIQTSTKATSSLPIIATLYHRLSSCDHLPISFMTYALDQSRPVGTAIKTKLDLSQVILSAMRVAGYNFMIRRHKAGKYFDIKEYLHI